MMKEFVDSVVEIASGFEDDISKQYEEENHKFTQSFPIYELPIYEPL